MRSKNFVFSIGFNANIFAVSPLAVIAEDAPPEPQLPDEYYVGDDEYADDEAYIEPEEETTTEPETLEDGTIPDPSQIPEVYWGDMMPVPGYLWLEEDYIPLEPFSAVGLPTLTGRLINLTSTSVTLEGEITGTGGANIFVRGFWIRPANDPNDLRELLVFDNSNPFSRVITGLTPGTEYVARAIARNVDRPMDTGQSQPEMRFTTPSGGGQPTVPGAPQNLAGFPSDGQVRLEWNAPSNGGSPILGYWVYVNGVRWGNRQNSTVRVITGLQNGISYTFAVRAENAVGESGLSNTINRTPGAAVTPILEVDTTPWNLSGGGIRDTVAVRSNVTWAVTSSDSQWLRIAERTPSHIPGDGSFVVLVDPNPGPGQRVGTITVSADGAAPQIITVTQDVGIIINLNANGGTVTPSTVTLTSNVLGNALDNVLINRPGYEFAGWFTAPTLGNRVAPGRQMQHGETLYARWYVNISLNPQGGSVSPPVIRALAGTHFVDLLPNPTPSTALRGQQFEHWRTADGVRIHASLIIPNQHTPLFAHWDMIWHSVPQRGLNSQWIPDTVRFWPGNVRVFTQLLGAPGELSEGFDFHNRVNEAMAIWAEALDIWIAPASRAEDAQIRAYGGTREAIKRALNMDPDTHSTWDGLATSRTPLEVGTFTADGVERNIYRLSGYSRIFVVQRSTAAIWSTANINYTRTVTNHELGHALGWWGHSRRSSGNERDVMWANSHPHYTLTPNEIRHLRQIYDWYWAGM